MHETDVKHDPPDGSSVHPWRRVPWKVFQEAYVTCVVVREFHPEFRGVANPVKSGII